MVLAGQWQCMVLAGSGLLPMLVRQAQVCVANTQDCPGWPKLAVAGFSSAWLDLAGPGRALVGR